jgi:hypothetical protein
LVLPGSAPTRLNCSLISDGELFAFVPGARLRIRPTGTFVCTSRPSASMAGNWPIGTCRASDVGADSGGGDFGSDEQAGERGYKEDGRRPTRSGRKNLVHINIQFNFL